MYGYLEELKEKRCFMVSVEDRTAATLIPIIKQYILPGTKVMGRVMTGWRRKDIFTVLSTIV